MTEIGLVTIVSTRNFSVRDDLTREVAKSMFIEKVKLATRTILFLGAVATCASFVAEVPTMERGDND